MAYAPLHEQFEKAKRCPIQTGKNIASPLSFTTYLCVSSKCLRLYLLSKYKQLKASGKWTFPMFTPESLRQMGTFAVDVRKPRAKAQITSARRKCLRQNGISGWKRQIASGKTAFPVENIKLPQEKRHFQRETTICLRLWRLNGENAHLPKAFGCLRID